MYYETLGPTKENTTRAKILERSSCLYCSYSGSPFKTNNANHRVHMWHYHNLREVLARAYQNGIGCLEDIFAQVTPRSDQTPRPQSIGNATGASVSQS